MTNPEVLKQEEIDALLGGVNSGEIATAADHGPADPPRRYDFASEIPVASGQAPKLELVNERCARLLRGSFSGLLHQTVAVSVQPLAIQRCGEFLRTLPMPSSINLLHVAPLRGTALIVLAPALVSAIVDRYFGGSGKPATIEGRDFTATEARIAELVRKSVCADFRNAWAPVAAINPEHLATESNAQFVNQVSPAELMIVVPFRIELDGDGGDLQLVLPYAMIEALRERLDTGLRGSADPPDQRWYQALRGELEQAEVGIRTVLGNCELTLGQLLALRPGDVVPFDFAGQATVYAEGIPIFSGGFGASRGQEAVKVERCVSR